MLTNIRDRQLRNTSSYMRRRQRRFSPLMLIGLIVPLVLLVIGGSVFAWTQYASHAAGTAAAADPNPDCTLIVPADALTAQGLATPYQLVATNAKNGPCHETNADQSAFVQSTIYDPASGTFSVYSPVVVDKGKKPAIAPFVPQLPTGAVVSIWFGFNGGNLKLQSGGQNALTTANCVNGQGKSIFGQFAYCNATAFWTTVNNGLAAGKFTVPALQTAKDGLICPTVRDFSVIDQDQSDNVQTKYLVDNKGRIAQFSTTNQAQLQRPKVISNPSDNGLLSAFINPALGCASWNAPDLANNGAPAPSLALDELQAAQDQKAPIALVPETDPMAMIADNNGNTTISLNKTNLYRAGVDQQAAADNAAASGKTYCQNFVQTGLPRILLDKNLTINQPSPAPAMANNLFTFLAARAQMSYVNINCQKLLKKANPVTVKTKNDVAVSATIHVPANNIPGAPPTNDNGNGNNGNNGNGNGNNGNNGNGNGAGTGTGTGTGTGNAGDCTVNGTQLKGCTGTIQLNGQTCTFTSVNNQITISCPKNKG